LLRQRAAFERSLIAALKLSLKGSPWKFSGGRLFAQLGDMFVDATPVVHRNAQRTIATLAIKPMAVDAILWDIFDLPQNANEPLSFRTRGAFTCSALPLLDEEVEHPGDAPDQVAAHLTRLCLDRFPDVVGFHQGRPFSDQVREHPNQRERGAYAISLVCALVAEGRHDEARNVAEKYANGTSASCHDFTSKGRSFHEFALDWLAARVRAH
jgi:hypothetical protein